LAGRFALYQKGLFWPRRQTAKPQSPEAGVPNEKKNVRIELTNEQRALVKEQTGIEVPALELKVEELESRIAPTSLTFGGGPRITYNP
jgi:hypothetical protein